MSGRILIVGSKQYDFDREDIRKTLESMGHKEITGIDISPGDGVDFAVDITNGESNFMVDNQGNFGTVICMEVMTHVLDPFAAARNLFSLLRVGGSMILSECYVRKISKMPLDLWRFTYDGTKQLHSSMVFDDSRAMISLTRDKNESLMPLKYPLPQLLADKHIDESSAGYFLRRLHRKFFAKGIFRISRLFPETTIYSVAFKN